MLLERKTKDIKSARSGNMHCCNNYHFLYYRVYILAIFAQVEKQGRFEGGLLKKRKGKRKEKKEERKKRRKGSREENKKYQGKGN